MSAIGVAAGAFVDVVPHGAAVVLLAIGMFLLVRFVRRAAHHPRPERVLVVGSSPIARRLVDELETHADPRPQIAWLPDRPRADLARAIRTMSPNHIVVGLDDVDAALPVHVLLAEREHGIAVEDAGSAYERLTGKTAIELVRPSDLLLGGGFHTSWLDRASSRALGIGFSVVGLIVAAPLLATLAIAIKLDSPGPVLFRQPRIGLGGRPFQLVKLRTMRPGAHASEWEQDNRERVTGVGQWLRKTHLDELPQLWNVLVGDMNLVGPRPHPVANAALFAARIPYYELRSLVRPGITGWAQIRYGYANNLDEEIEKTRYDLYYLRHRSFWLDVRLVSATLAFSLGRGRHVDHEITPRLHAHRSHHS